MASFLVVAVACAFAVAYVLIRNPKLWRWLSGHPLDGKHRTNASWLHRATAVHHPTPVVRWHHLPRLARAAIRTGATLAVLAAGYGYFVARALTVAAVITATAAGAAWGARRAWLTVTGWRHHRSYVRPLHWALAALPGIDAGALPRDWLQVNQERTCAVIDLPRDFAGKPAVMKQIEATVTAKLAIEAPEPKWELEGARPKLIIRSKPAPPRKVTWDDVAAAVESATESQPVIGMGRGGRILALDLHESPHILLSVPTGGGKSTLLRILIPGMLAAGRTVAAILDFKWISHPWVKGGLPNVLICQDIADIHVFLEWLHDEITRRNRVAWSAMDIEGRIHGDVGPRIVVNVEELNSTMTELRRYWRRIRASGDPDMSPAVDGLNMALLMGRQVKVHVIVAGQQVTAQSIGGGVSRENLGTRILGRYSPAHWRMLAEEVPVMPPSSRRAGRVQIVSGARARECQAAEITGAMAVELAKSRPMPWPSTLPLSLRHGVSIGAAGDTPSEQGDLIETVTPPPLPPGRDSVRLSDAVALGVLNGMSLSAARKASHRPGFPEPDGWHGIARTWAPETLREWVSTRRPEREDATP